MKLLSLLSIIILSMTSAFAAEMTASEQNEFIFFTSKEIRRSYWVRGYQDVESSFTKYSKVDFTKFEKEDSNSESPLNFDEYEMINKCLKENSCILYRIDLSAQYYGGYGHIIHWQLLDINKRKAYEISHTVYSE